MTRTNALLVALAVALTASLPAIAPAARAAGDFDLPISGSGAEPEQDVPLPPEESDDPPPKFYDEDIPDTSDSVVYVVDRSGSMDLPIHAFTGLDGNVVTNGSRLDFVKTELIRSIQSLPQNFSFNIVIYSECIDLWKPSRLEASPGNKADAIGWVSRVTPYGWTNTGGATARALADRGNQAVMLLSDGEPNFLDCSQSYVGDYETHKRVIRSANSQRATIHCFGIGLDPQTRAFMQQVATENGGTFKELD